MDESKKINAGKYKNKQRYKNKSKLVEKNTETKKKDEEPNEDKIIIDDDSRLFQKRGLESNWYRYEAKQEEEEDASRDFSILASAPISQASYFQFKSDRYIADSQDINQIDNKLFNLDVNLLNLSVATVPFNVCCDIDEKYFSELHLNRLKKEAEENILKLNDFLKSKQEEELQETVDSIILNEMPDNTQNMQQNVTTKNKIRSESDLKSTKSNNENLEEWLEDILDD